MTAPLTPGELSTALDEIAFALATLGDGVAIRWILALEQLRAEHAEMSKRCIACGSSDGHYSDCMNNIEGYLAEDPLDLP